MFSKTILKNNLLGCLEICLFMKSGVERFDAPNSAVYKSFLLPLLIVPILLYIFSFQWAHAEYKTLLPFQLTQVSLTLVMLYGAIYLLSKSLNKEQHFLQFAHASNWVTIPIMLFIIPIGIIVGLEINTYENVEGYAIVVGISRYILTGFIATHALRLPWQLGAFVGILNLAVDDLSLQISNYVSTYL